jgi:hypothetical protein
MTERQKLLQRHYVYRVISRVIVGQIVASRWNGDRQRTWDLARIYWRNQDSRRVLAKRRSI